MLSPNALSQTVHHVVLHHVQFAPQSTNPHPHLITGVWHLSVISLAATLSPSDRTRDEAHDRHFDGSGTLHTFLALRTAPVEEEAAVVDCLTEPPVPNAPTRLPRCSHGTRRRPQ